MPETSTYEQLRPEAQGEVDRLLQEHGFRDYSGLVEQVNGRLQELGVELRFSRTALHRQGKKLQTIIDRVKESHVAAKYLMSAYPEEEEALSQASLRMAQDRLFTVLMDLESELTPKDLGTITRAIADISRANITEKKYRAEVQAKAEKEAAESDQLLKDAGVSDETAAIIRAKFLGIAG